MDKPTPLGPVQAIIAERRRQQTEEGYTVENDATQGADTLARAAAAYALCAGGRQTGGQSYWPWADGFKPKEQRRNLVVAGALIIAALEAIERQAEDALAQAE